MTTRELNRRHFLLGSLGAAATVGLRTRPRHKKVAPVTFTPNVNFPANIDYASGLTANSNGLNDPQIQGAVINVNWSSFETANGTYNWTNLDNALAAWSAAGKWSAPCLRFAAEENGGLSGSYGMLPTWAVNAVGPVPASGAINQYFLADADSNSLVPNYWNSTMFSLVSGSLGLWPTFVKAFAAHLTSLATSNPDYVSSIVYIRIATGLGGEGFALMPGGAGGTGPNYNTYLNDIETATGWSFSANNWLTWQENLMTWYRNSAGFPTRPRDGSTIPLIYGISQVAGLKPGSTLLDGNQCSQEVGEWAVGTLGGYGCGQENMGPSGFGTGAGYGGINNVLNYMHANYPYAYTQVQSANNLSSAQVSQSISSAKTQYIRSIEWYESIINAHGSVAGDSGAESYWSNYQSWVNTTWPVGGPPAGTNHTLIQQGNKWYAIGTPLTFLDGGAGSKTSSTAYLDGGTAGKTASWADYDGRGANH